MAVRFDYNRRGGLTVDRDSLHESEGYKRQVGALKQLPERKSVMCDLWNKRREKLEQAVKDAAMELFGHTNSAAFRLDLGSGLYVEAGPEGTHLTQPAQAVDVPATDLKFEAWPADPGGMRVYRPRGVKVTHKPTGITVACDHERSPHANRDAAMRALTAALPKDSNGSEGVEGVERECEEQARLNGMGAERELALRARLEAAERDAAYGRALQSAMEAEYQAAKESRKGGKQEAWITTYTLLRRLKVAANHLTAIDAAQEGEG